MIELNIKGKGQVFTPKNIVNKILDDVGYKSNILLTKKILDPACGDGKFLVEIVARIIKYSNIIDLELNLKKVYGWDIDEDLINITKRKLDEIVKPYNLNIDWNLTVINSLHFKPNIKFDYIVGNPPYINIRNLNEVERFYIKTNYNFCNFGMFDIFITFFELASKLLKDEGVCGFISPNNYFYNNSCKKLRNYLSDNRIIQITNYNNIQIFKNVVTM